MPSLTVLQCLCDNKLRKVASYTDAVLVFSVKGLMRELEGERERRFKAEAACKRLLEQLQLSQQDGTVV